MALRLQDELLKQMPDFSRMSKRFQIGKANLDDVVRAYQAVSVLPEILNQLVELSGESDDTGMALDEQSDTIRALLVDTYIAKLRVGGRMLLYRLQIAEVSDPDFDALLRPAG